MSVGALSKVAHQGRVVLGGRVLECTIGVLRHRAMRRLGEVRDAEIVAVDIRIVGYDVYVLGDPCFGRQLVVVGNRSVVVGNRWVGALGVVGCRGATWIIREVGRSLTVVVYAVITLWGATTRATTAATHNFLFDALDLIDLIDVGRVAAGTAADYILLAVPGPDGVIAAATYYHINRALFLAGCATADADF